MPNIKLKVSRSFEILKALFEAISLQEELKIQQKLFMKKLKQKELRSFERAVSEPTLIKYIDFLESLGFIKVEIEYQRRGFIRKYLKPTGRGVIFARIYGIDIPEKILEYAKEYYPLIDKISSEITYSDVTLDTVLLYIILLSIGAQKYPLSDLSIKLSKLREGMELLLVQETCIEILSGISKELKEIKLQELMDLLPKAPLKEEIKYVSTSDELKIVLEKVLLFAIVDSLLVAIKSEEISILYKIRSRCRYVDIEIFIGAVSKIIEITNRPFLDLLSKFIICL